YVDYKQDNWDELLPMAEFAINNHKSTTTGYSPFYLNYGRHLPMTTYSPSGVANPTAEKLSSHIQEVLLQASKTITKAQENMKHHADKHRREVHFNIGDSVLLHSENITVDNQKERPSAKLAGQYIGPFKVLDRIGEVAYKLELPENMKIHNVFHVSKLK